MRNEYEITSHESFLHDSIDSLGYDWERLSDPDIRPKHPLKVYLPQSTEEIVQAVREAKVLGQKLGVRSKGHSSNDLVLVDRGNVLITEKLNRILGLDEGALTVKVQSGVILAQLDKYLSERGHGLPIIGDHNHITAGGFASVGGISPGSHSYGLFIDNVNALEYVTWDGEVVSCSRTEKPDHFYRVLAGTGRHGVIATLTLRIMKVDKFSTIMKNYRPLFWRVGSFIRKSEQLISSPGDAVMERGVWLDYPILGRNIKIGQFSSYKHTPQNPYKTLRNRLSYGFLHYLGYWAGRLPVGIDRLVKYLGMMGVMLSPKYASIKNIEVFTDRVLDSSVGDPTRMLIVLAPTGKYALLFRTLYDLCLHYRAQTGCFSFISIYVKAIQSNYLAQGDPNKSFCELMVYLGVNPKKMTDRVLDEIVSRIDDLCIEHQAFRYMHTKTVKDLGRRQKIDPNAAYVK